MFSHLNLPREQVVAVTPPPPGVVPNFIDPSSIKHILINTNIILSLISAAFVALRLYTIIIITHNIGSDDCKLYKGTRYGLGLHLWDVPFTTFIKLSNLCLNKVGAIAGVFYGISIMFTKLSILSFYLRFSTFQKIRIVIYVIMAFVIIYSFIGSFEFLFRCRPIAKYWDLSISYGSCIDHTKIFIFSGAMNTATDIIILILPVFILWNLHLPRRQKIGVILILMTGGFVLAVSIVRLKMIVNGVGNGDVTWDMTYSLVWWVVEMHIAIVCACLPAGKPFLRKHFPQVIESIFSTSSTTKKQTLRSSIVLKPPVRDGDEILLNEVLGHSLDGRPPQCY
ncbi:hypothetical protein GQ44DRAFT_787284 [Phaeosphaeriaceae sp. PMI808]|nr:hypothetical protein GQ44DRAFT_787284 [Phaeosphaeriaceae sp. PMI808]